jgi:DNA primase
VGEPEKLHSLHREHNLSARVAAVKKAKRAKEVISPPGPAWEERGLVFLRQCQEWLWTPRGRPALQYLKGRGIKEETAREFGLGFNPDDGKYEPGNIWGSDHDVWVPDGIIIPCFARDHLWSLKGRRLAGASRYAQVTGSKVALFGLSSRPTHTTGYMATVMPEGDFETMLLTQEARHLVWACTLGGVANRLDKWAWELRNSNPILLAYDADEAGLASATSRVGISQRMRVIRPAEGKDITEMYLAGHNLAAWIRRELSADAEPKPVNDSSWNDVFEYDDCNRSEAGDAGLVPNGAFF